MTTSPDRRPRLLLGGPQDGQILEVREDRRTVMAANTADLLQDTPGMDAALPVTTYVAERVNIFGTEAIIYMAQGMTREERDREAFRHLIRPELREALTP